LNSSAYSDTKIVESNTFPWDEQNVQSFAEEVLAENPISNPADEFLFHKLIEKSSQSQRNDSSSSVSMSEFRIRALFIKNNNLLHPSQ
jgi:hypothetical protein